MRLENGTRLSPVPEGAKSANPTEFVSPDTRTGTFEGLPRDDASMRPDSVGEAACVTFGTRLLQRLSEDGDAPPQPSPTPPEVYMGDSKLLRRAYSSFELPNKMYGKLLVKTFLQFMGPDFDCIPRKAFLSRVDETYNGDPNLQEPLWLCRMFAMFALGELYSTRMNRDRGTTVPGTGFFIISIGFLQDLYEEPSTDYVEALVLVVSFML